MLQKEKVSGQGGGKFVKKEKGGDLVKLYRRGFGRFNEVTFCWFLQGVCLSGQTDTRLRFQVWSLPPPDKAQVWIIFWATGEINITWGERGGQALATKTRLQAGKQWWCCRCGSLSNIKWQKQKALKTLFFDSDFLLARLQLKAQ